MRQQAASHIQWTSGNQEDLPLPSLALYSQDAIQTDSQTRTRSHRVLKETCYLAAEPHAHAHTVAYCTLHATTCLLHTSPAHTHTLRSSLPMLLMHRHHSVCIALHQNELGRGRKPPVRDLAHASKTAKLAPSRANASGQFWLSTLATNKTSTQQVMCADAVQQACLPLGTET